MTGAERQVLRERIAAARRQRLAKAGWARENRVEPVRDPLLDMPEAQPVIARLGRSVDPDFPDRMEHVLRVARIVMRAKREPSNAFARATL